MSSPMPGPVVAKQHPILRTRFRWEGLKVPLQEVVSEIAVPFEARDLSGIVAEQQEEALRIFLAEDRLRAFALDVEPLWRVTVLRLASDRLQTRLHLFARDLGLLLRFRREGGVRRLRSAGARRAAVV